MRLARPTLPLVVVLLAAGCSTSTPDASGAKKAEAQKAPGGSPAEAATAAKAPAESLEAAEADARLRQTVGHLTGKTAPEEARAIGDAEMIVTDPKTGQRLSRIPKGTTTYQAREGVLYNALLGMRKGAGETIVKEDADYWYINAPRVAEPARPGEAAPPPVDPSVPTIVRVPASEGEVVQPRTSQLPVRFVDASAGLPTSGMWRENFAIGDLDGDGRAEIVAPTPRLSGLGVPVYRYDGKAWATVPLKIEAGDTGFSFEYGAVALSDLDGDGKLDIVYGQHGGGVKTLKNLGDLRFRVDRRGLPAASTITTRAVAAGDVDGDGRPDIVVLSDDPQNEKTDKRDDLGDPVSKLDPVTGDLPGWNMRLFRQQADGTFRQDNRGLGWACYGYSVALQEKPVDGGAPILASSCHFMNWFSVLFEYDRKGETFRLLRNNELYEAMSYHSGVATGTYQGHPAVYASYLKGGPSGAEPKMSGQGLSVYYRTSEGWKRKRIYKEVSETALSRGVAVGDLDGDGLDDVVFTDERTNRVRVFFQTKSGEFEELDAKKEPTYPNSATSVRLHDLDGDGRLDIVVMYQYFTGSKSRAGGLRVFLNRRD